MNNLKMSAGAAFPPMGWDAVGGGRVEPAQGSGWRLLVVYRGKHCPICKTYLDTLQEGFCRISQSRTKFGRILQARDGPGRTYAASA